MKVNLEALFVAFGDESVKRTYYLDSDSGRVFNVLEDHDDPETQELMWALESDTRQRYIQIPKPTLEETLKEQDSFVASLGEDSDLKTKIEKMLEEDHDGSKFAGFVVRDRVARETWRDFRVGRSRQQANEWLKSLSLLSD